MRVYTFYYNASLFYFFRAMKKVKIVASLKPGMLNI